MDAQSRPRRRADVLVQSAGDTVILLTPDSGEYYTLNEVGGRIWDLADGSRSIGEIAAALATEYEASAEEIEADALQLLGELSKEHLVAIGDAPA